MNWKLLFRLSLFGLIMALATISFISTKIEPVLWLAIFIACSWFIARNASGLYFWHGFVLSLINCVFITSAHIVFYHVYITNHPEMSQMTVNMAIQNHPRLMMLMTGPVIGVTFGLVQGLFSYIAGKLVKKES